MATGQMETAKPNLLSELKTVDTATSIPVVNLIFTKAHDGYETVKNSNVLVKWYLSTTEAAMSTVARISMPIVNRPLKAVDGLTSMGLNMLVAKMPAVNTPPEKMVSNTKTYVSDKAAAVGNFSLRTTNSILNNRVGLAILGTVDKVTDAVDGTFYKYLPKPVGESETGKFLPEDDNELAKSLNKITCIFATVGKRFLRKRRIISNVNNFKKLLKSKSEKLRADVQKIRNKTTEQEDEIVSVRSIAKDVIGLVSIADFVKDGLTEDQQNDLTTAREKMHGISSILEQVSKIKDLGDEAIDDMIVKIDFIYKTLMDVFTAASVNWYKIPEERILAAKDELITAK